MSAGETEFLVDQGSTFQAEVVWQDANNAAINITHYDARMDVRYAQTKNADLDRIASISIAMLPLLRL